jgi:hypothetical protein
MFNAYYIELIEECAVDKDDHMMEYYQERCLDMVSGTNPKPDSGNDKTINRMHSDIVRLIKDKVYIPR